MISNLALFLDVVCCSFIDHSFDVQLLVQLVDISFNIILLQEFDPLFLVLDSGVIEEAFGVDFHGLLNEVEVRALKDALGALEPVE